MIDVEIFSIQKICKVFTIFTIGALCYGFVEILNRGYTHITMGILGGFSFLVIHILNGDRLEGKIKLFPVILISAFFITSIELFSGEILNNFLKMNIWSYEDVPLNFDEQICLPFSIIWMFLAFAGIFADNFIRLRIFNERKTVKTAELPTMKSTI